MTYVQYEEKGTTKEKKYFCQGQQGKNIYQSLMQYVNKIKYVDGYWVTLSDWTIKFFFLSVFNPFHGKVFYNNMPFPKIQLLYSTLFGFVY